MIVQCAHECPFRIIVRTIVKNRFAIVLWQALRDATYFSHRCSVVKPIKLWLQKLVTETALIYRAHAFSLAGLGRRPPSLVHTLSHHDQHSLPGVPSRQAVLLDISSATKRTATPSTTR